MMIMMFCIMAKNAIYGSDSCHVMSQQVTNERERKCWSWCDQTKDKRKAQENSDYNM